MSSLHLNQRKSVSTSSCKNSICKVMAKLSHSFLYKMVMLVVLSMLLTRHVQGASAQNETLIFLDQTGDIKSLNAEECFNRMDNTDQAIFICGKNPDLLPLLLYAERVGKEICEATFKNDLWNCSDFSILKEPNVTKGEVYKESSYVYALSLAVLTHTFAKACHQDLLKDCSGDPDRLAVEEEEGVEYKYSSDNIKYGLETADFFLRLRYQNQGHSLKKQLISHNFLAAQKVIINSISDAEVACSCHGVSGSCTLKLCNSELPRIEDVLVKIKEMYDKSCRVKSNGHTHHVWIAECEQGYTELDLIYRSENDWCRVNPNTGSRGVEGRVCDDDDKACQDLCSACGRTTTRKTDSEIRERDCEFVFCCRIECQKYIEERTYHVCS